MPREKATARLRWHSYGHDAGYKGHRDPASDAKTCDSCGAYKPLTSFRRVQPRGYDAFAFDAVCKTCRQTERAACSQVTLPRPRSAPEPSSLPADDEIAAATEDVCERLFINLRWPDGPCCPKCGETHLYLIAAKKGAASPRWRCSKCPGDFTPTSGTPFAGRKASMQIIIRILALVMSKRGALVIRKVAADLALDYKSAYTLVWKAREFLGLGTEAISHFKGYTNGTDNHRGLSP